MIGNQKPTFKSVPAYKETLGDLAGELAGAYGLSPDEWQQDILDDWLAIDEDGHYICQECSLMVPRQNGKNGLLEMRELYGLLVGHEKILHTAHEVRTARKAFLRLCEFFDNPQRYPELAEQVAQIRRTNGQEAIELKPQIEEDGTIRKPIIEFSSRSKSSARGFTVDTLIFDEAQELTDEQLGAIIPTTSASPSKNAQKIFVGTPPVGDATGETMERQRQRAKEGKPTRSSWHEWSIPDLKRDIEDKELWARTNPALGIRISIENVESEFRSMSVDTFARERLGWWCESSGQANLIKPFVWSKGEVDPALQPPKTNKDKVAFGIKFSPDGLNYALCASCKHERGCFVELIEYESTDGALEPLANFLLSRKDEVAFILIDGKSNAGALYTLLTNKGYPRRGVAVCKTSTAIDCASMFYNAIQANEVAHTKNEVLDASALASVRRSIGNSGAWGFGSGQYDSAPLEACGLAHYAVQTTKRDPRRKQRLIR